MFILLGLRRFLIVFEYRLESELAEQHRVLGDACLTRLAGWFAVITVTEITRRFA